MKEPPDHIILCQGCGIPMDECPDTWDDWFVQQRGVPCPHGDLSCTGHILFVRYFCTRCGDKAQEMLQAEEKCPHGVNGRSCEEGCPCACHYKEARRTA